MLLKNEELKTKRKKSIGVDHGQLLFLSSMSPHCSSEYFSHCPRYTFSYSTDNTSWHISKIDHLETSYSCLKGLNKF